MYDKKNSLKLFTLRFYGLTIFVSKKMYYQIRFGILYSFAIFFHYYCYFDFSKQHFTKDYNKKKSHGSRNETTLYLLLKTCRHSPETRTSNFN